MDIAQIKTDEFGSTVKNTKGESVRISKKDFGILKMAIFKNYFFICLFKGDGYSLRNNVSAFDLRGEKKWTIMSKSPGTGGPTPWVWIGEEKFHAFQICVTDDVGWTFPIINLDTGELGEPSLNRWG